MKIVIYLCGTYFKLAKEGEAQKTECEDVVFLYQVKMLQKHCVLQLQLLPEDGPHLVDQAEVWQDALLLVYLCTQEFVVAKKVIVDCIKQSSRCTVSASLKREISIV